MAGTIDLYRYLDLENPYHFKELENLLKEEVITLKRAEFVNDYFDFHPSYDYTKDKSNKNEEIYQSVKRVYPNIKKNMLKNNVNLKKAYESYNNDLRKLCYYCSFSKNFDQTEATHLLMWSHYANNHKGLCLKIKFNLDDLNTKVMVFDKIKYEDNRANIKKDDKGEEKIIKTFFYKSKCWKYEDEYRLVETSYLFEENSQENQGVEIKKVKIGKLEDIYFGLNCYQENIDKIRMLNKKKVNLFKAKEVPKKFQIDFKRIT